MPPACGRCGALAAKLVDRDVYICPACGAEAPGPAVRYGGGPGQWQRPGGDDLFSVGLYLILDGGTTRAIEVYGRRLEPKARSLSVALADQVSREMREEAHWLRMSDANGGVGEFWTGCVMDWRVRVEKTGFGKPDSDEPKAATGGIICGLCGSKVTQILERDVFRCVSCGAEAPRCAVLYTKDVKDVRWRAKGAPDPYEKLPPIRPGWF